MADAMLNKLAFCKIILHAMKYPHCTVNGVLLIDKSKMKDSKVLTIVDSIPLFHLGIGLTPMLEVALTQIDFYCKKKDMVLAGYYQANANYRDCSPDYFAHKISEKLHENYGDAVLIMVDNRTLSMDSPDLGLHLYHIGEGKLKARDDSRIHLEKQEATLAALKSLLMTKSHQKLIDFDNHLDNMTLSWENLALNAAITGCV